MATMQKSSFCCNESVVHSNRKTISDEEVLSLVFSITNRCNLRCSYCYQNSKNKSDHREITAAEVMSLLEFFAQRFKDSSKYVQFTGGEPFLRKDIFRMIDHALNFGYRIRISTNGILLHKLEEELLKKLSHQNISIRITLDGPDKSTHGAYRPGESFKFVLSGLERVLHYNTNVGLKTVIHDKNINKIKEILDLALEYKVDHFSYNHHKSIGRGATLSGAHVGADIIFDKLLNLVENDKNYIRILKGTPFANIIMSTHTDSYRFLSSFNYYINSDGRMYANSELQFNEFLLSVKPSPDKINFKKMKRIREMYELANKSCCKKCIGYNFCFGGSLGELYKSNGSLYGEFNDCDNLRKMIISAMSINNNKIVSEIKNLYLN